MIKIIFMIFFIVYSFGNDVLRCGTLKNLAPFSIKKDHKIDGISIEYWKIVQKKLNIKEKRCKIYDSWDELLYAFDSNKIDLMIVATKSLQSKNAVFSKSYDKFPISIATKDNIAFVPDIRVLKSEPIGIVKDSMGYNIIKEKYPNLKFVVFNNIEDALEHLEEGEIKAIIESLPILIYAINDNNYLSIRISGKTGIDTKLSFMLNKKFQYLIPKINKELDNISTDKKLQIYNKWLKLNNFWTWEKIELMLGIGVFILITLFVLTFILKRDIKRRELLEKELIQSKKKAEIATKAKSEFLANMSHEIRTPLNVIFGFITILKDSENNQEKYKYLTIIENNGKNLQNILNDILDFSEIETGKFKIENVEFDLTKEIKTMMILFKSKANEKNISIQENIKKLTHYIITDPVRLKQIISNLLSNAIKFTEANKKIYITIDYNENDELLYVEIKDEGIGISKDKLKTIFEVFNQADNSTTRKYGGTGLGLSISYQLVEMLGGELKVESELNKGSKFYFNIPAKKGNIIQENKVEHKEKLDKNYNYHVLLVEDNKANQMFMKVILNKLNITFDIANDGLEAIDLFKKNKYDLILMDENMPNMNGIEATKKIREYEKENNLNPVIISACTANVLAEDKEKFILSGMNYYLSKPLDINKLKDLLDKIK